jgi:hypothetical protein
MKRLVYVRVLHPITFLRDVNEKQDVWQPGPPRKDVGDLRSVDPPSLPDARYSQLRHLGQILGTSILPGHALTTNSDGTLVLALTRACRR